MTDSPVLSNILENTFCRSQNRGAVMHELRRLLPTSEGFHRTLPFGLAALDSHLPEGGLACNALHEVVPQSEGAFPSALGFIVAFLGHAFPPSFRGKGKIICIGPRYEQRPYGRLSGRLSGHGLKTLGLDPSRLILVETSDRKETLWALAEALRSTVPLAVVGTIDKLDLKISQKLQLAACDAGLPLFLLRPAQTLQASAAATRWRAGLAEAARDRFGLYARPRWHLQLERCRNGRPGEWVVEYDHVAHRFSLAAALADPAFSCGAGDCAVRATGRS